MNKLPYDEITRLLIRGMREGQKKGNVMVSAADQRPKRKKDATLLALKMEEGATS